MRSAWVPVVVAVLVLLGAVDASDAQVFFGAEPRASLTIGPLFVVGTASPDIGTMTVTVAWNVLPDRWRSIRSTSRTVIASCIWRASTR